ncbi:hypothetical protein GCM10028833_42990 [Glycomyces tarimensis]
MKIADDARSSRDKNESTSSVLAVIGVSRADPSTTWGLMLPRHELLTACRNDGWLPEHETEDLHG